MSAPPGAFPDPVNPNDLGRGPLIVGLLWSLTIVAAGTVAARFYVRRKMGGLASDDWIMLAALLIQVVDMGFLSRAYSFGLGKHDIDMTFDQLINAIKWGWLYMIPGVIVAVLARISSAIFLIRLFGLPHRWLRWFLIIFTTLQTIGGIVLLFVSFLGVQPIEALWNPFVVANRMDPKIALVTAYVVQGLFTVADLTYVLFPTIIIWRLKMSLSKRVALILLMSTSLITVAVSIMKALSATTVSASLGEPQYAASLSALWSGIEQTLVIIMASVPALRAVSKLDNGVFSRLSSFASRFSLGPSGMRSSKKASQASSATAVSYGSHGQYYNDPRGYGSRGMTDTAMSETLTGTMATVTTYAKEESETSSSSGGSRTSLNAREAEVAIRRTDQFVIEYPDGTEKAGGPRKPS